MGTAQSGIDPADRTERADMGNAPQKRNLDPADAEEAQPPEAKRPAVTPQKKATSKRESTPAEREAARTAIEGTVNDDPRRFYRFVTTLGDGAFGEVHEVV